MPRKPLLALVTGLAVLGACSDPEPAFDYAALRAPFKAETAPPSTDNEVTPEKVALGEKLYRAEALSKDGTISCNSCHDLDNYGVDSEPTSPGVGGALGDRNSPTTFNAFRQLAQFWDGREATVEDQAIGPVLNPVEHGVADEAELIAKIKADPDLVAGFGKAFAGEGDPVTVDNFKRAVGAFERTLVTRSAWDDFLEGKDDALGADALTGLKTFIESGCTVCHINRAVGGSMYQKLGLVVPYEDEDPGRAKVTGNAGEKQFFKVPTLLNVAKTAPYFHHGKVATLPEAVKLMAHHQLNKQLTDEQVKSIVAFLESLTGKLQ